MDKIPVFYNYNNKLTRLKVSLTGYELKLKL